MVSKGMGGGRGGATGEVSLNPTMEMRRGGAIRGVELGNAAVDRSRKEMADTVVRHQAD